MSDTHSTSPSDGLKANSPTPAIRLSPPRLASWLGVSPATVIRWCAAGRINARKSPGGRWWIDGQIALDLLKHFEPQVTVPKAVTP